MRELTFPFPVNVIAGMLGLPEEDLDTFHREAVALTNVGYDMDRGLKASQWLRDYFAGILAQRREQPGNDVIILPTVSDEEAKKRYPGGWKAPRPYIRIVAQPH